MAFVEILKTRVHSGVWTCDYCGRVTPFGGKLCALCK